MQRLSGVLAPTQAASVQCALGRCNRVRLYFVRPPVPTSTGRANARKRRKIAQRVAFTAAASPSGRLAFS